MARSRSSPRARALPQRQVRYAVVGLGHIAQAAVLPAFRHASNSKLTALVSGNSRKRKELGARYRVPTSCSYEDADRLFTSGEIDAVYIALPNDMHRDWTVRAAAAGLHVLCEKPMAVTAQECQQMIRAATQARVKLMVGYRLHFERANLEAAELARRGSLGELRYFSSDFSMNVRAGNIRLERPRGGGPLYDIGIYCINAARYALAAEPVAVQAAASRSEDRRFAHVDATVVAMMRYEDERMASFTCSFGAADRSTYTIAGTRGTLTLDPAYEYAQGAQYLLKTAGRSERKRFPKTDQFAAELMYFSDCILQDRTPEPAGEEGLLDVRVIEALLRSIRTGRTVTLSTPGRVRRPTLRQEIRRPPVQREPSLVQVAPAGR